MAAKKGYLQMVELFLKKGASVNIQTYSGETPLYLAAMAGHKDVVQLLIQRGANVNLKEDDGGWSPLHRAVENDFEEIVEILVANKADAYSQNKYNATPWSIAHNKGNKKIIELLKKAPRISEIVCRSFGEIATPRIFGGEGTEDGEFPAMAALGYFDRQVLVYKCGGSIISDQFVLTAAHCIYPSKPRVVRLGKAKIFDDINDPTTAVIRNIKTIIIHPGYNLTTKWNDIALIRVFDKIPFNDFVWPACLHTNFGDVPSSQNLTVTGWGISDPKRYTTMSKLLRKANLKSMPLEECRTRLMLNHWQDAALQSGFIEGQYCAYGAGVTDACRGDSGGPLQYLKTSTSVIVGIVSVGDYCGLDSPGIYTRVASYLDWIESYVWSNLYKPN
ncbi:serine protease persephone-like [Contarinia nasturtii]|uniref:serine protease persephone-like n=1 Tax=Contarinia nasturtii TaxID=265458 RepID=UPI0012D3DF42|nr:serine protease persephone-like [Contarinia nasturtii]